MAQTKAGGRTHGGAAGNSSTDDIRDAEVIGTDVSTVDTDQGGAAEDVIAGVAVDLTREAAAKLAEYVQRKNVGPNMTQILMYIAAKAVDTAELNTVISEQLAARILNATNPDDIFDPFGTTRDRDFVNKPLNCEGVMYLDSDKSEGFPWYVALDIRDPQTGNLAPVIVGGEKLVPQVAGLDMHDAWPCVIQIGTTTTRQGFTVYGLVPPAKF